MNFSLIRNEPIGRFGGLSVPDAPEPIECDGEFRSDVCEGCSEYDECKRIAEEEGAD